MPIGRVRRNNNRDYCNYKDRIIADSGLMKNDVNSLDYINFLRSIGCYENSKIIWSGEMGFKKRTSTIYDYISKAYSANTLANNMAQATELNQPFICGNIAPFEKQCIVNNNNSLKTIIHTSIDFTSSEPWTIVLTLNDFNSNYAYEYLLRNTSANDFKLLTKSANANYFRIVYQGVDISTPVNNNIQGKTYILIISNDGVNVKWILNGALFSTTAACGLSVGRLFGIDNSAIAYTKAYSYRIQSGSVTLAQAIAEYNFLRAKYPEIESVTIGTQIWSSSNWEAICTPVGNVIPEMQLATATEKITVQADREFSSDTGYWEKVDSTTTITSGVARFISSPILKGFKKSILTIGKYYKVTFSISSYTSGTIALTDGNYGFGGAKNSVGTWTLIFKATAPNLWFMPQTTFTGDLDNISCLELGWANSTEIYDTVYAATSGTTAQKEYAALKEAGMWAYYNNDPILGSIYGKLYNWYAVRLFDLDFATSGFGWHAPSQTDFTTLQTYLGGASVAGGKMKMTGTNYFSNPNVGATNEAGFTGLGSGYRSPSGAFLNTNSLCPFWGVNGLNSPYMFLQRADTTCSVGANDNKLQGFQFRIIKN